MIFPNAVIESKRYRGSYMYANVVNSVSHYVVSRDSACNDAKYRWYAWYDSCSGNYYFRNVDSGNWLDASDAGLVKHTKCNTNAKYGWKSCGNWRRWQLQDITDRY